MSISRQATGAEAATARFILSTKSATNWSPRALPRFSSAVVVVVSFLRGQLTNLDTQCKLHCSRRNLAPPNCQRAELAGSGSIPPSTGNGRFSTRQLLYRFLFPSQTITRTWTRNALQRALASETSKKVPIIYCQECTLAMCRPLLVTTVISENSTR